MQVIDQINGSALFAQSAYSAAVATKDSLGRDISTTYLTAHQDLSNYATTGDLDTASSFLSGAIDYVSANAGGSTDNAMTGESQSIVSAFKFYDLTNGGATVSAYTPITAGTYGGAFKLNGRGLILSAMSHSQWGDLTDVLDISPLNYGIRGNYLGLNSAGVYFNDGFQITWTGIKNTDLGITTGGIVSSISGHLIPSTAGLASQTDLENVSGEIVGLIPSTAGLATEQLVESTSADIVAMIPSTAGLASESDLQTVSGDIVNLIPDTSNFITNTSAETTYQPIGNYASASDITGFATKTELETTSGEIVGLIPSTAGLATETDLQIVSGGVDYISGVALTAIPTGTMNETAFAYNADDLITAYNGSAFAGQGGGSVDTIPVAVISPLVTGFSGESAYLGIESTALNLSSYVPVSAIGVNSLGYVSGISGMNISAYYSRNSLTANYASTANRSYEDRNGNEITSYYQPKLTITGDAGTITSINGSAVGASIPEGWELVAGQGIEIVDDAENNQTTISVTAAGGNPEVESYVQTNSASIDDAISTYQSNSGSYITQETDWTNTITAASSYAYSEATAQIPTDYYTTANPSGFITNVSAENTYQTITGMTAYQPVGDYATTAEVDTLSSMLSGAIDYVSANAGDEFPVSADEAIQYVQTNSANIDETVTSFQTNSSTYMIEPNLEYNSQGYINGYNGSAVATIDQERQWFTHDSTLCHISNSSQYALGINMSAISADLARMMGVDETVLWEGDIAESGTTFNLNENINNFNKVSFYTQGVYRQNCSISTFEVGSDSSYRISTQSIDGGSTYDWVINASLNGTSGSLVRSFLFTQGLTATSRTVENGSTTGALPVGFRKVVGVGRKS